MAQQPTRYIGTIEKKEQLADAVFLFTILNTDPVACAFTSGQYMTLVVDQTTRRQYTMCSAPDDRRFQIVVDVSPMGKGSRYLLERTPGDRIEYLAPLGSFTLMPTEAPLLFVATGTGIAPFRSMVNDIFRDSVNQDRIVHLYWGLRYEHDLYWQSDFEDIARQYRGFKFFVSLSKPSSTWSGMQGHITNHVLSDPLLGDSSQIYLCGNSAMITEMREHLIAHKIKEEQIKVDLYY